MTTPSPTEPPGRGHRLLRARLAAIPAALRETWDAPASGGTPTPARVVATGIGSSEAHARHLAGLLNRWGGPPAEFRPLSAFLSPLECPGARLAVFSQGLSANVQPALARRGGFAGLTLFTAATEAGLRAAGRSDRADALAALGADGAEVVRFPLEQEYTILIRVIGPACGFLAARQWAARRSAAGPERLGFPEVERLWESASARSPVAAFRGVMDEASRGFTLLTGPGLGEAAWNLACKFVEGLFWPAPQCLDLLAFAHGPFQQIAARPRPVVALVRDTPLESDLADRAERMCEAIGAPFLRLGLTGCASLAPLEAEALFNPILADLVELLGVDQVNWPGKGLDAPLYAYP